MSELVKDKVSSVVITGGEPLLFPNLVLNIAEQCVSNDIKYSINSNLTVCEPNVFEELLDFGKVRVLTSIASFSPDVHDEMMGRENAFNETIFNVRTLAKLGVDIVANMVLTNVNVNQVYETGRFISSLGLKTFAVTKASCPVGIGLPDNLDISKDDFLRSVKGMKMVRDDFGIKVGTLSCYPHCALGDLEEYSFVANRLCGAGKTDCVISSQGDVRACVQSDKVYGNIFRESLSDIYAKMDEWRDGTLLPTICKVCEYFAACGGGCRYNAQAFNGVSGMDVFATKPEDVVVPLKQRSVRIYDRQQNIFTPSGIKSRPEDFGRIFSNFDGKIIMVDGNGGRLVDNIIGRTVKIASIYEDNKECSEEDINFLLDRLLLSEFSILVESS
jgi:radical SAM protein with 4Fe4S-binding SPASM domain